MSYVIQRVSRGPRAIAAYDEARGRTGLGLVVGGKTTTTKGLVTTIGPLAPTIVKTTMPVTTITTTIPKTMLQPVTTQIAAQVSQKFAPPPVVIQKTDPSKSCESGYFYSSIKNSCQPNCAAGYYLSEKDECLPLKAETAPPKSAPPPVMETPRPEAKVEAEKCGPGYYLDSSGRCMPVEEPKAPVGVPAAPSPTATTPATPGAAAPAPTLYKPGGGGAATWQPLVRTTQIGPGVPLPPDMETPLYQAPPPAPRTGISTTQILLFGALGLGAIYLLTRK